MTRGTWKKRLITHTTLLIYLLSAVGSPQRVAASGESFGQSEHSEGIPAHLFMPQNPPAPGKVEAEAMHLHYLLAERTTNYHHASASQGKNIELVARRLNGIVVKPGQTFSYIQHLGPFTAANGYGWGRAFDGDRIVPSLAGGVCQGASTLYSALLKTGLTVVERHQHGLTVPYLPAGEDATVSQSGHLDFRFRNDFNAPVLITATTNVKERSLTVALWGAHVPPQILIRHRVIKTYPYRTIVHSHTGMNRVLFPGQKGGKVESWLEVRQSDGAIGRRSLDTDTYLPSPRIVEQK